ncbi:hypothetical protein HanIR_Chr15g0732741 [Helianthus annuus]|nr:hypothetical protein HanIR_Chr15g0732741 [Helianthus annuus]
MRQQSWQCKVASLGVSPLKFSSVFQMAKYSSKRTVANNTTNNNHDLFTSCRFRTTQTASDAIYSNDIALSSAKLARSNTIMVISRPKSMNIFSIQNFKYIFKDVFCISNLSFLND